MPSTQQASAVRRNYNLLVAEGILFTLGMVFFDPNTILPLLMSRLTASTVLVGLVGAVEPLAKGFVPVISGNWINALPYKKRYLITAVAVSRLPLWILGVSLILVTTETYLFWAGLLLLTQVLFWFGDAAGDPAWMDMVGKSVPSTRRGRFFATRQVVGGVLAVLAGALVARILAQDQLAFPVNYGIVVSLGALIYTANVGTFMGLVEKPSETTSRLRLLDLIRNLPRYLSGHTGFLMTMVVLVLINMARLSLPFYIVFGRQQFGLTETALGILIPVQIVGRIMGAMFWGLLGDRFGHQRAIQGVAIICILPPIMALAIALLQPESTIVFLFSLLFFFVGVFLEGWAPFINYMLDIVPERERPLYAGLMSAGHVPAALAPIVGGAMVLYASYQVLFGITALTTFVGLLLAFSLKPAKAAA